MRSILLFTTVGILLAACRSKEKTATPPVPDDFAIIAYYSGSASLVDSFPVEKLTHIIFSFGHLKGNRLSIDNAGDTATIQKLVSLKKNHSNLKVMLSLGGWGGCEFCSPVFASDSARKEFARSTMELLNYFNADGIDLDWEYPAIEGYPGHAFNPADKQNFTSLVKELRSTLGEGKLITFAAGGFEKFLAESIEWKNVMPLLDMVNIMSYDLVSGFSTVTGHHTPLYSSGATKESVDRAVRYLDSLGVPKNKMVIGSAFYARVWENVEPVNNGLYQGGRFKSFVPHRVFPSILSVDSGYVFHHDSATRATYAYNAPKKRFATFDDSTSVRLKTEYARQNGLKGIMFWELTLDKTKDGLLDIMSKAARR